MTLTEELQYRDALKEAKKIRKAAKELVDVLTEIFESPEYLGVFLCAQNHHMEYSGKNCKKELENLKKVLKDV